MSKTEIKRIEAKELHKITGVNYLCRSRAGLTLESVIAWFKVRHGKEPDEVVIVSSSFKGKPVETFYMR